MPLWDFLQSNFEGGIENNANSQIIYRYDSIASFQLVKLNQ